MRQRISIKLLIYKIQSKYLTKYKKIKMTRSNFKNSKMRKWKTKSKKKMRRSNCLRLLTKLALCLRCICQEAQERLSLAKIWEELGSRELNWSLCTKHKKKNTSRMALKWFKFKEKLNSKKKKSRLYKLE